MVALSADMFIRKTPPHDEMDLEEVKYLAPEELKMAEEKQTFRQLTTVSWRLGAMMYETHFHRPPFATHL